MRLEDIGFYTLSNARIAQASPRSPLWRCELVLTARCNFRCPYCRHVGGGDLPYKQASAVITEWGRWGLKNARFSGGEPTLYPRLIDLVRLARAVGAERVAVSTNGSASLSLYRDLIAAGVDDFSVSLDACCAEDGERMAGGIKGSWSLVIENIRALARETYVTVGVVLTEQNAVRLNDVIRFAHSLGVADIRVIPAAQRGPWLETVRVDEALLDAHPVLKYRIANARSGLSVRGLGAGDANRCGLVADDMAVMGGEHYPCIIYMREGGAPVGRVGPAMRSEREEWAKSHDTHADPICAANCLDVCREYNTRFTSKEKT